MAKNFPCPGCGAGLEWSPGAGDLTCPYCGHHHADESLKVEFEPIKHPFSGIAGYQGHAAWSGGAKEIGCGSCGASFEVEATAETTQCPFCGSNQINPHQHGVALIPPDAVLPFVIERDDAVRQFRAWLAGLWFRPNGLKELASFGRISGSYLPVWSYDADTESSWTAERGDNYTVQEEYRNEKGETATRSVTHTRWSFAAGTHSGDWDNVMINASKAIDQKLLDGLVPFVTNKSRAYDARLLQGFAAERYQLGPAPAFEEAKKKIDAWIRAACARMVGGDTQRNLVVRTEYSDPEFALLLAPVWIAAYEYQGKSFRYLVNGQTGKAHGTAPYSAAKIVLFILVILGIIGALVMLSNRQ